MIAGAGDAIVIRHVSKHYRSRAWKWPLRTLVSERTVLQGIDLTVARGEIMGVLGANGAGKTTLLHILGSLALPDGGTLAVNGTVAYCGSGERGFYYRLSARENLRFFGALSGIGGGELERRITRACERVDLPDLDQRFSHLSSGMRQRLALARALIAEPDVLLLDEPTRAVDPAHAHSIRRFVRELADGGGVTVLLATNSLEEAFEICDRVAILARGTIAAIGDPRSMARAAQSPSHWFSSLTGTAL